MGHPGLSGLSGSEKLLSWSLDIRWEDGELSKNPGREFPQPLQMLQQCLLLLFFVVVVVFVYLVLVTFLPSCEFPLGLYLGLFMGLCSISLDRFCSGYYNTPMIPITVSRYQHFPTSRELWTPPLHLGHFAFPTFQCHCLECQMVLYFVLPSSPVIYKLSLSCVPSFCSSSCFLFLSNVFQFPLYHFVSV